MDRKFTAGQDAIISIHSYSDYSVLHTVKILKDFDLNDAGIQYLRENPAQAERYKFEAGGFIDFLQGQGFIKLREYDPPPEIWLGEFHNHPFTIPEPKKPGYKTLWIVQIEGFGENFEAPEIKPDDGPPEHINCRSTGAQFVDTEDEDA